MMNSQINMYSLWLYTIAGTSWISYNVMDNFQIIFYSISILSVLMIVVINIPKFIKTIKTWFK